MRPCGYAPEERSRHDQDLKPRQHKVHFAPPYDEWFNKTYIKEWGEKNDTEVTVDNIGAPLIPARAAAEVGAQKGHDLFMFLAPPAAYEDQVIDHKEINEECRRKYGDPIDLAIKSTFNPETNKYIGVTPSYVPDPLNYRKDLFDGIGMTIEPDTWDDVRVGGRKIKQQFGNPVGIGLSQELDTSMAM